MTRGIKIKEWAQEYSNLPDYQAAYICGAIKADDNPKNPWRDAKTSPPKDGQWYLFRFTQSSWSHGLYEARQMPNMAINDYIKSGDIISWMPIPELQEGCKG